jgi:hypothetical protein
MINLPHISRFPIIYISIWLWGLYISYDSRYAKSFEISGKAGGFVEVIPGTFWAKIHTFGAYSLAAHVVEREGYNIDLDLDIDMDM